MNGRKARYEPEPKDQQPGQWDDDTQRLVDDLEARFRREFGNDESLFDENE